jgi:hypothetical protein
MQPNVTEGLNGHEETVSKNAFSTRRAGAFVMKFKDAVRRVTAEHIKRALAEINKKGVPKERRSRTWCLKIGSRRYPPKYVLSLAVKNATGRLLPTVGHPGGERTNGPLRKALRNEPRYSIVRCTTGSNTLEH